MPFIDTLTLAGLSRSDGATARTLTMGRVGDISGGFILREQGVLPALATEIRYSRRRMKVGKQFINTTSIVVTFPYADPATPTVVLGYSKYDTTGLKIPDDCPQFVRNDIRTQLANILSGSSAGTVAKALVYDPLVSSSYPF